jgi:hypothetical protein
VNWSKAIQKTNNKQDQLGCPNIAVFSEIKAERSGKSFSKKGKKGIRTHVFLLLGSCPHLSHPHSPEHISRFLNNPSLSPLELEFVEPEDIFRSSSYPKIASSSSSDEENSPPMTCETG